VLTFFQCTKKTHTCQTVLPFFFTGTSDPALDLFVFRFFHIPQRNTVRSTPEWSGKNSPATLHPPDEEPEHHPYEEKEDNSNQNEANHRQKK
jgi:hypothetical protein